MDPMIITLLGGVVLIGYLMFTNLEYVLKQIGKIFDFIEARRLKKQEEKNAENISKLNK